MGALLLNQVQELYKRNININFTPGCQIKVYFKISEAGGERVQVFEGTVIRIRGGSISKSFTVRKISFGIGVERIFPLHSPCIDKIEIVRRGKVRRAKLYYLRNLSGKSARIRGYISKNT
ncbi:MAG: 50S ribosomal protein L19 [Endomicrobium sp.]|jgi:large subunit ribosomal protein L19|nr:50S ribosomal protein L19 [Endomicrobium sp.]